MNILKLIKFLMIDQFVFGVDEPGGGGTPPADPPPTNVFGSLPETWRSDMISAAGYEGDDAKTLGNMFERVPDLKGLVTNYKSMQDKIRAGELSSGLPENPSEEQLRDWRQANGVPESFDAYKLDGVGELSDDETEIFNAVFKVSHDGNVSNAVLTSQVKAFKDAQEAIIERRQQQDGVDAQQAAQVLKDAWKGDYTANMNHAKAVLNRLPEAVREQFSNSRMSDGRAMMNVPEVLEFFAGMERQLNPTSTVVPSGTSNPVKYIDDRIAEIQQRMYNDRAGYDKDKSMQAELLQLLEAKQNQK